MKKRTIVPVDHVELPEPWAKIYDPSCTEILKRRKLAIELGIIDVAGNRIRKELPPDMRDTSTSDV